MPSYIYRAKSELGKPIKGILEGQTKQEVVTKLQNMGYIVTQIGETSPGIDLEDIGERFRFITAEDIIMFNIQLANMINAGLTLLASLKILENQVENRKLKDIVGDVSRSIEAGSLFSEALSRHPRVFSKLFVSMVRAGEASGNLALVLDRFAQFSEEQQELRQKIKGALFYPAILFSFGVLVIIFIVTYVMPNFVVIFQKAGVKLPLPTQILYALGIGIKRFWYLAILGIGLIIVGFKAYLKNESNRLRFDQFKLNLYLFGPLLRKASISRFCRTLATLVASAVPILESLDIAKEVMNNEVISQVVAKTRKAVEEGESISGSLKISEEFPQDSVQMIAVAEQTGDLPTMLNKIADFYDRALTYQIKKLTAVIEPLFLVIMGALVAFIMASMMLPIFDMVKVLRR
ncbi:MAG: type II secretion system F family protein [Candidatus Omnitrophota bacterium]